MQSTAEGLAVVGEKWAALQVLDDNALCGYPHVKLSIRDLSQISATAPIFQQYMSFSALFEIPTKDMAQKYGSTVKNLTLGFSPKLLGGVLIHVKS